MPRLPPVTRTMPSAVMTVVPSGQREQAARDQLLVGRDDMVRHGGDGAAGVGVTATEVTPRAHEHVNDGLEFLVAEIMGRAGMPRTPQDPDVGGRDIVEMFLVADRRKEFGLVENAQEFRPLADEVEESAKSFDLLPRRVRRAGPLPDETDHVQSDLRQQLIEQSLAIFEMIIEGSLRDAGLFGDPGDGGLGVPKLADDFGGGIEYPALRPRVALDPIEFCHFSGSSLGYLRHALASSSARSTRLSTLPDGLRGRLSRMKSCFGTLKAARCLRQCAVRSGNCSTAPSAITTTATGFSPQRSSG